MHLNKAWAHRDLYAANRYRSKCFPHEFVTIMHDKMDHAKTASPVFSHKTKHLDGLTKLPLSVTGMLVHGYGDVRYTYYGLDLYPHDATIQLDHLLNYFEIWSCHQSPQVERYFRIHNPLLCMRLCCMEQRLVNRPYHLPRNMSLAHPYRLF